MSGNLVSPLARRREGCAMQAHDRLPAPLRLWLTGAALPWSAASARRIWEREVRRSGVEGALRRLAAVEAATLARERGVSEI
ncbi:MAG: hypothetical protein RLZZ563_1710 [Pseudomonadota bacterium]